jgi:pimeloyl-ACP methyl ester carboxylesterase
MNLATADSGQRAGNTITSVTFGTGGNRRALVLSPVLATWDRGAFFAPITATLVESGYEVTVFDTLSLLDDGDDLSSLSSRWADVLAAEYGRVDLLAGNALGGAVVTAMLSTPWANQARVLLLSSPTVADSRLSRRLDAIAHRAAAGRFSEALRLLEFRVAPSTDTGIAPLCPTGPPPPDGLDSRCHRLAAGLRLLTGIDLSRTVLEFPGALLSIYGRRSQLVAEVNVVTGPAHRRLAVPDAGMRPHLEFPELVGERVRDFVALTGVSA